MSALPAHITRQNLGPFEPNAVLTEDKQLRGPVRGGLKQFFRNTIDAAGGGISIATSTGLITEVADFDDQYPLICATPFRYAATPEIPQLGLHCTAEETIKHAVLNMAELARNIDPRAFSVMREEMQLRKQRSLQWRAQIDEEFELRVRGGSGAATFSIDLGLGNYDPDRPWHYGELWRTGIDTIEGQGQKGTRFIRTGSGIKPGDENKTANFDRFRKTYGMLPQRLLGLMGLYVMRELQADFALALTTEGAVKLSTLGKSQGTCDYTGIFRNIGFIGSQDNKWALIPDFKEGFFDALDQAGIRRHEGDLLSVSAQALNNLQAIDAVGNEVKAPSPFTICSQTDKYSLEREIKAHAKPRRFFW